MHIVQSCAFEGAGKVELVEGVIVREPFALTPHMHHQRLVNEALHDAYREAGSSRIVQPRLTLRLGTHTLRVADVGVLDEFYTDVGYVDLSTVLLVAEIADLTRNRDLRAKRLDYAHAGIPNYWVIDVQKRATHLMSQPRDGDYAGRPDPIAFGQPLAVPETDWTIVLGQKV